MQTFGERLKDSMRICGMATAAELAEKAPVSEQIIRKWLKSTEPRLSAMHLIEISMLLNVRATWLATGKGPVSRFHTREYTEEDMLKAYRALGPKGRIMFRDLAGVVIKNVEG